MNRNLLAQHLAAMEAILWDEQKGAWFDYDLEKGKKNLEIYPSNLTPLWAGCFSDPSVADRALKYSEVRGQWAGGWAWHPGGRTLPSLASLAEATGSGCEAGWEGSGGTDLPSLRAQGPWLLLQPSLTLTSMSGTF